MTELMFVPSHILRKLYTVGSLTDLQQGLQFTLKNRLKPGLLQQLHHIKINGQAINLNEIKLMLPASESFSACELNQGDGLTFGLGDNITIEVPSLSFSTEPQVNIDLCLDVQPFGRVQFDFNDHIRGLEQRLEIIPRDANNDFDSHIIQARRDFIAEQSDFAPQHLYTPCCESNQLNGNIEHFIGYAHVPVGIAGPVQVKGEYAKGKFMVPLATTEGTLVASYNRGMKLLNLCGGANVCVIEDRMQRAPVFIFISALKAKQFVKWIKQNLPSIQSEAESTDSHLCLLEIETYQSNRFAFLRFNFATGDAAGQNMVGQATFAACNWILTHYSDIQNFYLESNFATDKKASQINILKTRGKRVTAEVTIKADDLYRHLGVTPKQIDTHARVASVGSFLSGVNNTGLHAANGIAAVFIATGQDAANVAESSTGILFTEVTETGDLYLSLTLPSLIVATIGGGTGLATQKECLQMMQCAGTGNAKKLAEIVAATALAGEISLAAAISSFDWVAAHEQYGRNG